MPDGFQGHRANGLTTSWIPRIINMSISMSDCTGFDAASAFEPIIDCEHCYLAASAFEGRAVQALAG